MMVVMMVMMMVVLMVVWLDLMLANNNNIMRGLNNISVLIFFRIYL